MRAMLYALIQYAMIAVVMATFARVALTPIADADISIINRVSETVRTAARF